MSYDTHPHPPVSGTKVIRYGSALLLLLLRGLSGLVLQLLDRLLRVALVSAIGLDLYFAKATSVTACLSCGELPEQANNKNDSGETYRALAVTGKALVPLSLAFLLLFELLLLELLGFFGGAGVCSRQETGLVQALVVGASCGH